MLETIVPRNPKYGWIPDLPDQRDYLYAELAVAPPPLPKQIDLRHYCSPIESQGELGACTACALVGNLEYLKKFKQQKIINFSKLFLYYHERMVRGTVNQDSGASLRDGIKTLVKIGDCLESLWPYKISKYKVKPPQKAYTDAQNYQITNYYRLHSLTEMKHTLSDGYPFVFGFAVYESLESALVTETGIIPLPQPEERVLGGHAVMAVGYNDSKAQFIIKNSWGQVWGNAGYGFMPYTYLTNSKLSADFWTIRGME
jgi:C1A family cysteine protease